MLQQAGRDKPHQVKDRDAWIQHVLLLFQTHRFEIERLRLHAFGIEGARCQKTTEWGLTHNLPKL